MNIEKHIEEFLEALNGGRGTLDAWLECNNEAECRAAINGAISAEREACAKLCEDIQAKTDKWGPMAECCAEQIRMRSNGLVSGAATGAE